MLNSGDDKAILTGLQSLKSLCKRFEFELEDGRKDLHSLVQEAFPFLGAMVSKLMEHVNTSRDA